MGPAASAAVLGFAAAVVAVLVQVGLAEVFGFTHLGGPTGGGDDRTFGVNYSLLRWFVAVAVIAGATLARAYGASTGRATASGAVGGLVALPFVVALAGTDRAGFAVTVLGGVVLGAGCVYACRFVGVGVVAYASSLWFLGVLALAFAKPMQFHPGMVETLGLDRLDDAQRGAYGWTGLPYDIAHYHLPAMVPCAVIMLTLVVIAARTGPFRAAIAGPVLAAITYWIPPMHLEQWNRAAAIIVLILGVLAVIAATISAVIPRRDAGPEPDLPAVSAPETG
jgi:hypothetical protein